MTTKTLILARHAEAELPALGDDLNRKLTPKGRDDAQKLGLLLQKEALKMPVIFSSHSERTLTTAKLVAPAIGVSVAEIKTFPQLYNTTVDEMLEFICTIENKHQDVLIFSHNPTVGYMAEFLVSHFSAHFSPGSAALIRLKKMDWKNVKEHAGVLIDFKTVF